MVLYKHGTGNVNMVQSEADKEKTAFICLLGFYQFERMPQGICGAPATFQRVMERTVRDMNLLEVLVYLDDLIIFGRTLEEHEERLLKVTDNNPLTYITKSAKLDATGHRWLSALSTYNFNLKYRPGRRNLDADALSRCPHTSLTLDDEWQEIPAPDVRAMCQILSKKRAARFSPLCLVDQMGSHIYAIPKAYCQATGVAPDPLPSVSLSKLQEAQKSDPVIGEVWQAISLKKPVGIVQTKHPDIKAFKKDWKKLSVDCISGLLLFSTYRVRVLWIWCALTFFRLSLILEISVMCWSSLTILPIMHKPFPLGTRQQSRWPRLCGRNISFIMACPIVSTQTRAGILRVGW